MRTGRTGERGRPRGGPTVKAIADILEEGPTTLNELIRTLKRRKKIKESTARSRVYSLRNDGRIVHDGDFVKKGGGW